MSAAWVTIGVLCVVTVAIKAVGPATLGGRPLPPRLQAVIAMLAPAVLAALVLVQTVGGEDGGGLSLDARLGGLAAGAGAIALKLPILVVVVAAAAVTAGLRALG